MSYFACVGNVYNNKNVSWQRQTLIAVLVTIGELSSLDLLRTNIMYLTESCAENDSDNNKNNTESK